MKPNRKYGKNNKPDVLSASDTSHLMVGDQLWDAYKRISAARRYASAGREAPTSKAKIAAGKQWMAYAGRPEIVLEAFFAVEALSQSQFAYKFAQLFGVKTVEKMEEELARTQNWGQAAKQMGMSGTEAELFTESSGVQWWYSAVDYAHAVMLGAGERCEYLTPGVLEVLRSDLGGIDSIVRCVLSCWDPVVMSRYATDARRELLESPGLLIAFQKMNIDTSPILNYKP